MDKLLKIKAVQPNNAQLLIRTDIETGKWFVHFYTKERSAETESLVKDESIFRGYYSNDETDKVLDSIIEWCLAKRENKVANNTWKTIEDIVHQPKSKVSE